MGTKQPRWRFLANLGDTDPIENGGLFVFEDTTKAYDGELEYLTDDGEDGPRSWTVYRVILDRVLPSDREWFTDGLASVAESMDYPLNELREDLADDDLIKRAHAYRAIYDYHGWENGDSYPLTFTKRSDLTKRYRNVFATMRRRERAGESVVIMHNSEPMFEHIGTAGE